MPAISLPWTLDALSDFRDDLLSRLSLCSSLTSLDIASPMCLHGPFCMLCSVAVFSIYNAFPEHSKQENWEKRCLCVSWLCGCAQDVKQDVDGRYIQCTTLHSCNNPSIAHADATQQEQQITAQQHGVRLKAAQHSDAWLHPLELFLCVWGQHCHTALLNTAHHYALFTFQHDPKRRLIRLTMQHSTRWHACHSVAPHSTH